eukprot:4805709-Pleurochrysis_carterae.AAC.1
MRTCGALALRSPSFWNTCSRWPPKLPAERRSVSNRAGASQPGARACSRSPTVCTLCLSSAPARLDGICNSGRSPKESDC